MTTMPIGFFKSKEEIILNKDLFLISGYNSSTGYIYENWYYDIEKDMWGQSVDINTPIQLTMGECISGNIICVGGQQPTSITNEVQEFNIENEVWDTTVPTYPKTIYFTDSCIINGEIYVFGGMNSSYGTNYEVYKRDNSTKQWSNLGIDNVPSNNYEPINISVFNVNGKAYLFGNDYGRKNIYAFDYTQSIGSQWTRLNDAPDSMRGSFGGVIGTTIYLFANNKVYVFDTTNPSPTLTENSSLNNPSGTPQDYSTAVVYNNKIYIAYKGVSSWNFFSFNPNNATTKWIKLADLPFSFSYPGMLISNDAV